MKLLVIGLFTVFYIFSHTGLASAPQERTRQERIERNASLHTKSLTRLRERVKKGGDRVMTVMSYVPKQSVDQLKEAADLIVYGTVSGFSETYTMFGKAYHDVIVDIDEVLGSRLPNSPTEQVKFEKVGGVITFPEGTVTFHEKRNEHFNIGERHVLFLTKSTLRDTWMVTGHRYGRIKIENGLVHELRHPEWNGMDVDLLLDSIEF